MQLHESEVKKYALANQLHLLQPPKLKDENFLQKLSELNADLFVVVAFRMLPEVVWNMPPLGTINLHASLLPQYRGAAPINWAIINGETETGVTTFKLQHEIDTGDLIFQEKIAIRENETAGELYHELMDLGKGVLLKTVDAIASESFPQQPQAHFIEVKHAPKIFKETSAIDWNKTTAQCYNLIRGLSPLPAAHTIIEGKILKIFSADKVFKNYEKPCGNYVSDGKTFLHFITSDGAIAINELQLEGKKRMRVDELLRGLKLLHIPH